jgi:hypothetical protein
MSQNQSFYQRCLDGGEPCRLLAAWSPTNAEIKHAEETYQILADEYLLWEYTSGRKTFIEGKFNGEWATSPGKDSALFAKHLLNFGSEQNGSLSTRSLLVQILHIRSYRDDWNSYGALAVSESAVLDAISWLSANIHPITNAPHISPSPGQDHPSGVAMEWSSESGELEIDFFGGGKMGFLIVTPGGEEEGEIPIKDWPQFFKSRSLERILAPKTNQDGGI